LGFKVIHQNVDGKKRRGGSNAMIRFAILTAVIWFSWGLASLARIFSQ
jgi:hypothetical protein